MKKISKKIIDETGKTNIIYGGGLAYGEIAREMEGTFCEWLTFSGLTESELRSRLNEPNIRIEESVNEEGNVEIKICSSTEVILAPLVHVPCGDEEYSKFKINSLLLLFHVSSRFANKDLERAAKAFAKTM